MNPHKIDIYVQGVNQKAKREFEMSNVIAHIQGMYFVDALLCTVGNMFKDKHSETFEYPKKPYDFNGDSSELTEDEIEVQRELFVARYMTMMNNFNLAKGNNGQGQEN